MAIVDTYPFSPEIPHPQDLFRRVDGGTYEPTASGFLVKPEVLRDLAALRAAGINAGLVDVKPRYELPALVQDQVDQQSAALGELPSRSEAFDTLFDPRVHSAGGVWAALNKRAIALWTLLTAGDPNPHKVAPGIDYGIYEELLFGGRSALDVLHAEHPRTATVVAERYRRIVTTPLVDDPYNGEREASPYLRFVDEHGFTPLSSSDFLTGVVDSRAVDTRGTAAIGMALEHVKAHPEVFDGRPIVTASLACGAAAPMFELDREFAANGIQVASNILVDNDPMALASAVALGRLYGEADKVDAKLRDIINSKLTDFIKPHSVDILDILGIVDYLPTSLRGYQAARNFLGQITNIMRPGGIIVAGNALRNRPHQAFFDRVWPVLQQRDPREMVDIITSAGYDKSQLTVRIPQREGIYGIYGIALPTDEASTFRETRRQRAARRVLELVSKFGRY